MKDYYLLNKKKIEYKSILKELTNVETKYYTIYADTDVYTINDAYIENGIIFLKGYFKTGIYTEKKYIVFPEKYKPRTLVNGTFCCSWTMDDISKIGYVRVDTDGTLGVWIDKLVGNEYFNIQYPLKVE